MLEPVTTRCQQGIEEKHYCRWYRLIAVYEVNTTEVLSNGHKERAYKLHRGNLSGLGLLELLGQHLLTNLLLLNEESSNNAVSHASVAAGTTIRAGHGFLAGLSVLKFGGVHVLDLILQ